MLSSKTKRELKIDQRQILIDSIEIGISSPQQILTWGERLLPNGKAVGLIRNSKTVNYKRFTPFRDGLFCERIFGPVTSFICACGKKQSHSKVTFCEKCEVEYIDQRSRRYRLGYISLLSPVTHIWYLKGRPSYLSLFLGKRKKTIVALAYCNGYLIEHGLLKNSRNETIGHRWPSIESFQNARNFLQKRATLPCRKSYQRFVLEPRSSYKARHRERIGSLRTSRSRYKYNDRATAQNRVAFDVSRRLLQMYGRYHVGDTYNSRSMIGKLSASCTTGSFLDPSHGVPLYRDMPDTIGRRLTKGLKSRALISLLRRENFYYVMHASRSRSDTKVSPTCFLNRVFDLSLSCKPKRYTAPQKARNRVDITKSKTGDQHLVPAARGAGQIERIAHNCSVERRRCKPTNTSTRFVQAWTLRSRREKKGSALSTRYGVCFYARQHTLPFLPSLVSHFYLRDALLDFIYSRVGHNDLAIVEYCNIERWEPLRDVHKFMAHRTVGNFKKAFSGPQKRTSKREKRLRPYRASLSFCEIRGDSLYRAFGFRIGAASDCAEPFWFSRREIKQNNGARSLQIGDVDANRVRADWQFQSETRRAARLVQPCFRPCRQLLREDKSTSELRKKVFDCGIHNAAVKNPRSSQHLGLVLQESTSRVENQSKTALTNLRFVLQENSKSSLSGLEATAIREILSYTGGGALQQLLQQFNQQLLCKFLFAEAQILRVLYESRSGNRESDRLQLRVPRKQESMCTKVLSSISGSGSLSTIEKAIATARTGSALLATLCPSVASYSRCRALYKQRLERKEEFRNLNGRFGSHLVQTKWFRERLCIVPIRRSKSGGSKLVRSARIESCNTQTPFLYHRFVTMTETLTNSPRKQNRAERLLLPYKYKSKICKKICMARRFRKNDCYNSRLFPKAAISSFYNNDTVKRVATLYPSVRSGCRAVFSTPTPIDRSKPITSSRLETVSNTIGTRPPRRAALCSLESTRAVFREQKREKSAALSCLTSKSTNRRVLAFPKGDRTYKSLICNPLEYKSPICKKICKGRRSFVWHDNKQNEMCASTCVHHMHHSNHVVSIFDKEQDPLWGKHDLRKKRIIRLSRRIYKVARRLKITQLLTRNHRKPEWMVLSHLPVLPPDLRPILQMSEKVIVASDLNIMYQRVIYRNNRHLRVRFIDFHLVTAIQRLVQDAVDRLIENGKGGSKPYYTQAGRPLKSLSDILKGKKGRFRLNLLGKRVDFSGRSVIVVSPLCQIHECGLPKAIALELYHYFLLRQLVVKKHCRSIVTAKKMIKERSSSMWDVLRELMYHHPVLLNRAPTLHRLGIQAFQPKLVLGSAILLHPLVCLGFNADFDGDQMGVHLPLSFAARAESWHLLWSRNNLLSPATGQPMLVPSQDMVLGFYYITAQASKGFRKLDKDRRSVENDKEPSSKARTDLYRFRNPKEAIAAFERGKIKVHAPVWICWTGKIENEEACLKPLELRVFAFAVEHAVYEGYIARRSFTRTKLRVRKNEPLLSERVRQKDSGKREARLKSYPYKSKICKPSRDLYTLDIYDRDPLTKQSFVRAVRAPDRTEAKPETGCLRVLTRSGFYSSNSVERLAKEQLSSDGLSDLSVIRFGTARDAFHPNRNRDAIRRFRNEPYKTQPLRGASSNADNADPFLVSTRLESYRVRSTAGRILIHDLISM